jgi:hypothetical protein
MTTKVCSRRFSEVEYAKPGRSARQKPKGASQARTADQRMIKWHYTLIRVVISIVAVTAFVALIVNRYEWVAFALFVSAAAFNLYLKYLGNRAPRN